MGKCMIQFDRKTLCPNHYLTRAFFKKKDTCSDYWMGSIELCLVVIHKAHYCVCGSHLIQMRREKMVKGSVGSEFN